MTSKIKKTLLIIGLIVCPILSLLVRVEAGYSDKEVIYKINQPVTLTQVVVKNGTQWIIQTTCKILKPI